MADIPREADGAPKAGLPSKGYQAAMAKVLADKAKVAKLKEGGKTSIYYDHQSPAVRTRRKRAQKEFEWFVAMQLDMDPPDQEVIWNVDTFIEYSKLWLSCVATFIKGKVGDKPKAGVLFQRKDALYWWAIRKIHKFTEIYGKWHAECVGLITYTADLEGFEKGNFQKNMLSDADLALFFKALQTYPRGREVWKQNYVMWIMVYLTGVRPGSFTVSSGYQKGAALGDGRLHRAEDETLRWSDIEFRRTEQGIIVKVKFSYLKGHRNPHSARDSVQASKTWTFVPSSSSRYEFDLALLLTGLAFSRGLFKCSTLEELMNGDEVYPPVNDDINKHPVFLQSGQNEKLQPGVAMHLSSANDKLRKICVDHGYYGRNTLYSFRRTALIETKRKHGTEVAQETAAHKPEGTTIYAYDVVGQSDIDWTADRLDQTGMTRKALRELYSQGATAKLDLAPTGVQSARADQLSIRVDNMMLKDDEYLTSERTLRRKMEDIVAHCGEEEEIGVLRQVGRFRGLLADRDSAKDLTLLAELDALLKARKNLKKKLRAKYSQNVKDEMMKEHKANMKVAREGARPKVDVMKDHRVDSRPIVDAAETRIANEIDNLATAGDDGEEEEEVEIDFDELDEEEAGEAPQEAWSDLPDDVTLDVNLADDEDPSATDAGRLAFLRSWVQFKSDQTSGLACIQCELDDTVPQDRKDERHTMYKLNRHLKSDYHSRINQIYRAFDIDQGSKPKADCPLCGESMAKKRFEKHLEDNHPEQLE